MALTCSVGVFNLPLDQALDLVERAFKHMTVKRIVVQGLDTDACDPGSDPVAIEASPLYLDAVASLVR